jgi:hypothetical protein
MRLADIIGPAKIGTVKMASLLSRYNECRIVLIQAARRRQTIRYGALAAALGLKLARQEWNTVLGPIAADETRRTGRDLTLIVVYASGPAMGLSRYFSNIRGGRAPQTTMLNPRDPQQVLEYQQELQRVFDTYAGLPS